MITLKELAPYLPYGLKVQMTRNIYPKGTEIVTLDTMNIQRLGGRRFTIKPILRPMSDLSGHQAEIDLWDLTYSKFEIYPGEILNIPYYQIQFLLQHHFDVFNQIPNGTAVSVHDIK